MSCPRSGTWGDTGGQKFNFLYMVMWHIKSKGVISRQGYTEQRGTCIKGLIWPPLEPKTESYFSSISSYWFIRRMIQVYNSGIYLNLMVAMVTKMAANIDLK